MRTLRLPDNPGYAAAVNAGVNSLKQCQSIIISNSDVEVSQQALEQLSEHLLDYPRAAAATPFSVSTDGRSNTHTKRTSVIALCLLIIAPGIWEWIRNRKRLVEDGHVREVQFAEGSCLLVDREVFEELGGFDSRYRFHSEDADFSLRVRKAGWKILHVPAARVLHAGGQSFLQFPNRQRETIIEGLLLFHWTHAPRRYRWVRRSIIAALVIRHIGRMLFARDRTEQRFLTALLGSVKQEKFIRASTERPIRRKNSPEVTVIVPTYNRPASLRRFFTALRGPMFKETEIVIVHQQNEKLGRTRVTRNVHNVNIGRPHRGMAKNAGLRVAHGSTVLVCDDDIIPGKGFLEAHALAHRSQEQLGITFRMVEEGMNSPDGSVFEISRVGRVYSRPDAIHAERVKYLAAGNMSVSRRDLARSGGYDESYRGTAVFEEADLCVRLRNLGVDLWFRPSPESKHVPQVGGNRSEREHDPRRYYILFHHNLLYYLAKNESHWFLPVSLITAMARSYRQAFRRHLTIRDACHMFSGGIAGIRQYYRLLQR